MTMTSWGNELNAVMNAVMNAVTSSDQTSLHMSPIKSKCWICWRFRARSSRSSERRPQREDKELVTLKLEKLDTEWNKIGKEKKEIKWNSTKNRIYQIILMSSSHGLNHCNTFLKSSSTKIPALGWLHWRFSGLQLVLRFAGCARGFLEDQGSMDKWTRKL